eukprot:7390359-Prymnesium_polylepis.2
MKLQQVLKERSQAASGVASVWAKSMPEQDTSALKAALAKAESTGVAHAAYLLPSGESGSAMVAAASEWLRSVNSARKAAAERLRDGVQAKAAELDADGLQVKGIDAANDAGGVDTTRSSSKTRAVSSPKRV